MDIVYIPLIFLSKILSEKNKSIVENLLGPSKAHDPLHLIHCSQACKLQMDLLQLRHSTGLVHMNTKVVAAQNCQVDKAKSCVEPN